MACSGCAGCSTVGKKTASGVSGCKSKGLCTRGGCNKMNSFDWLSDMGIGLETQFDYVEVRFKNGRKEFYQNSKHLDLITGDAILVEAQPGTNLGYVSLQGELVRLQMLKKGVKEESKLPNIISLAQESDIEKLAQVQARDLPTMYRTREIIREMKLKMKLSDVEFQLDNTKAIFYYSADDRVDFRELIKVLASEFKIRVEMKQISLRQEAGMLGGIGSCGRELCCSTWLNEFKSVSTSAARYQNLSLNPVKLSGQCGRLKCCLNYELETYAEALKDIPTIEKPILTQKGEAYLQKTDIFKRLMWFGYPKETAWHPIPVERVKELLVLNKKGIKPESLLMDKIPVEREEKPGNSKNPRNRNKNNYSNRRNKRKKKR